LYGRNWISKLYFRYKLSFQTTPFINCYFSAHLLFTTTLSSIAFQNYFINDYFPKLLYQRLLSKTTLSWSSRRHPSISLACLFCILFIHTSLFRSLQLHPCIYIHFIQCLYLLSVPSYYTIFLLVPAAMWW